MPNPRVANPRVAERAPWRSTKRGVAGVCSLLEMPTDSCHFPCTSDTPVRLQNSLAWKALSASRGLARGGLGTRQDLGPAKTYKTGLSYRDHGKGGLSLRGVAFMTVLAVLTVLESTLPSFCVSYKIQYQEAAVTVLTVLAVSAGFGGFGRDGYPP